MTKIDIYIDELKISADNFKKETTDKSKRLLISFDFKVTSETSHHVTTTLYKNDFFVKIPEVGLEFPATIHNYATSITDLYVGNAVADFHLELIETD